MSLSRRSDDGGTTTGTPDCLIDTDVVSYMFRRDTRANPYREYLVGKHAAISFMTLAEVRRWTLLHQWGTRRRADLAEFLRQFSVYFSDDALCTAWALIIVEGARLGTPIAPSDAWVVAPAWTEGIPLVTNNRRHFEWIPDLTIVSFAPL